MIETSIKVSPDQVFSDLAGKITAKDGDTVAHLRGYHGKNWWQPVHSRRPAYRDGWLVFDAVDDRLIEGGVMTDQTTALDKLIAEAVKPYAEALGAVLAWHDKDKHTTGKMSFERSSVFAKARAASKKGGA